MTPLARLAPAAPGDGWDWRSEGEGASFRIAGRIEAGWWRIAWRGRADSDLSLRLHVDLGQGFDEQGIAVGVLAPDLRSHQQWFRLAAPARGLRLDPGRKAACFSLDLAGLRPVPAWYVLLKRALAAVERHGGWRRCLSWLRRRSVGDAWRRLRQEAAAGPGRVAPYQPDGRETILARAGEMREAIARFREQPLISVLMPVWNTDPDLLRQTIASVRDQVYPRWELCIADDASTRAETRQVLAELAAADPRIKVVSLPRNGHICQATNAALALAEGAFCALLDHDDLLWPDALFQVAAELDRHPDLDLIYTDEDKIDAAGRRFTPYHKPGWSPDLLLCNMYLGHLSVWRSQVLRELGGMRPGFEGAQDHDLALRLAERSQRIRRIPRVLYSWRCHGGSTADGGEVKPYAQEAGLKAVAEALARRGEGGVVDALAKAPGRYRVSYPPARRPLVSVLIPTRDGAGILRTCLESLFQRTAWRELEVLVVDNGSRKPETHRLFAEFREREPERFRVLPLDIPFNYSRLNNAAAAEARGELLLLLNNDIEVIEPDWLGRMVGQALRPSVGFVGAFLLYPDRSLQHAGIILGIGGVAGHSHKHFPDGHPGHFSRLLLSSNCSAATAACLMVRTEVYRRLGGLDEGLQVAFNDVDFCLRVRALGLLGVMDPAVRLVHHESKTRGAEDTPAKQERFRGEIACMQERWGALLRDDPYYNPSLSDSAEDFSPRVG